MPNTALLSLVKERPDEKLSRYNPGCPFCGSRNVYKVSHETTLMGGGPDVNHEWFVHQCTSCGEDFILEAKEGNTWYTKDHKVLKGIPCCFEAYIYTCQYCEGEVHRKFLELDSGEIVKSLSYVNENGTMVKKYRTIYYCKSCGEEVETPIDYYNAYR